MSSAFLPSCEGIFWHEGLGNKGVPSSTLIPSVLGVAKEGRNIWMGCRSLSSVSECHLSLLRNVSSWSCLTRLPVQCGSDVAGRVLTDVSVPPQLGTELIELLISAGKLSLERLQQGEEVLRADSTSSKDLNSATFDRHYELTFESCTLTHGFITRQERVDILTWLACECKHFCRRRQAAFFFKC